MKDKENKMITFLKQLFCRHQWAVLYSIRASLSTYKYIDICDKCKKERTRREQFHI